MRIPLLFCGLFCLAVTNASADLYQWTDDSGVIHVVDESSQIPRAYREKVKVFESQKSRTPPSSLPLSPSRTYPSYSQGRFAQKLALDLGLIKHRGEDAVGPLSGAGIRRDLAERHRLTLAGVQLSPTGAVPLSPTGEVPLS